MLNENQINKIREMREKGLTIKETANALEVSESSVKKYTSEDYEKDNELDEKTGNSLTKQFDLEEYDFQDDIAPLVYKLKDQANEINVTLHDYLTDISNTMNKFLRITSKPQWFYYVFCELANSFSLINEHIDATKFMEAVDNWYEREIDMEESEKFIIDIETKAEKLVKNAKEEYNIWQEKIDNAQKEYEKITSLHTVMINNLLEKPNLEKLQKTEKKLIDAENRLKELELSKLILIEKCKILEQSDKDNKIAKKENILLKKAFKKLNKLFPQEITVIIQEIENEIQ